MLLLQHPVIPILLHLLHCNNIAFNADLNNKHMKMTHCQQRDLNHNTNYFVETDVRHAAQFKLNPTVAALWNWKYCICRRVSECVTNFISRISSSCLRLSCRRLLRCPSLSCRDCCVEDRRSFVASSSWRVFSKAPISSSSYLMGGTDERLKRRENAQGDPHWSVLEYKMNSLITQRNLAHKNILHLSMHSHTKMEMRAW